MQAWEEKIMEQNKAREEGIREGHASGLKEGMARGELKTLQELIEKKGQKGYSVEEIAEMLETDIETVQKLQKNKI